MGGVESLFGVFGDSIILVGSPYNWITNLVQINGINNAFYIFPHNIALQKIILLIIHTSY